MEKKKKFDYLLIVCIFITVGFVCLLLFRFTNSIGRLFESCRDFGLSLAYYFTMLFFGESGITVTVTSTAKTPFFDFLGSYGSSYTPQVSVPSTWDSFKVGWSSYWNTFVSMDNFTGYWVGVGNVLYNILYVLLILIPVILVIWLLVKFCGRKSNTDYNRDSLPLRCGRWVHNKLWLPVKYFCLNLFRYIKEHKAFWISWIVIWVINFNLATIAIEFLAFYFYFIVSFDVANLYIQFYKLILDLWTPIRFIPVWLWVVLVIWIIQHRANKKGLAVLRHRERMNRGFINERGVVTIVYGVMGAGKTALITDMALSAEVELRDQALEVILESDMKFPEFPWIELEQELKRAFEFHEVYDVWHVREYIRKKYVRFMKDPCPEKIFGYDFNRKCGQEDVVKRLTYNDGIKTVSIWQVIEDYSCAYLIYTRQCSLLISNYSIRTDNILSDLGNFPLWNSDFFRKDSRLMDSYSRHSHILDYDMLRLGKVMNERNPNRFAYGFGVYVITEIDKERKNSPELSSVNKTDSNCNQKNDLFNSMLKMSRHGVVIANRVFVKIIADLQRPTSLGADSRELGEVVFIRDISEDRCVLPWYSPFYLANIILGWLRRRFDNYYIKYRFNRGDNTLFCTCYKSVVAFFEHYRERKLNFYGSQVLTLDVESGRLDGHSYERKYYRQSKKIWSARYATDCLSGIFETRGILSPVGIDDLIEYESLIASGDELAMQNSHFQYEISSIQESIKPESGSDSVKKSGSDSVKELFD